MYIMAAVLRLQQQRMYMEDDESLIKKQIEYYRARALEYDQWFLRTGRYDRGEDHRRQWFAEVDVVREALAAQNPRGRILELACGTGLWTELLLSNADKIVAVDSSPEVLDLNRQRLRDERVEYIRADLFQWKPTGLFDFIFFSFWLSHVPPSRFAPFWSMIGGALDQGGGVFFVDSLLTQQSTAKDHADLNRSGRAKRKLNNGLEFEIVKIFYEPGELTAKLRRLGWRGVINKTDNFFLYGVVAPDAR
jgi:SAM-dependent methyltransferase